MLLFLLATGFVYWITKWKFAKILMCVVIVMWLTQIAFCVGTIIGVAPDLMYISSDFFGMLNELKNISMPLPY